MKHNVIHRHYLTTLLITTAICIPTFTQAKEIAVPFTSQAPYGDWREPWHNACEETSIVMVDAYYASDTVLTRAEAKRDILQMFAIKHTFIGESFDETAATVVQLINDFLPWEAHIIENPTLTDIKNEIDKNQPVIIPVIADALDNPHFRGTFPYHMLVISGYDDEAAEFITQEPGTRYGKNYRYSYETIETAIRDFDPVDMRRAPRRVIATSRDIVESADTDGDADGLTKQQELLYATSLTEADTDNDGYSDGTEVAHGYSPTINETRITNGSVVKVANVAAVFLYNNGTLSAFANEKAFLSRGYRWSQILPISATYRDLQKRGSVLY